METHLSSINDTIANPIRRYKDELDKPEEEIAAELSDGAGKKVSAEVHKKHSILVTTKRL